MTQKPSSDKLITALLQSIDPKQIAEEGARQTVELLLNLIEQLNLKIKELEEENQKLRDENNRLKGEQGKPDIKANKKKKGFEKDHSSEKERKIPKEHRKTSKNQTIKIDREEVVVYPQEKLPADAQFKGYEQVVVQDILLQADNVLFRKEKYYSPSEGKTYLALLPTGYDGEFGPGIKALVVSLYYGKNMTQGKLLEFLEDIGISMSAGYLSNLLIKNQENFEAEYQEVYTEGLASSPWQHFDQTGARVGGVNHTTNVICNPLYTIYQTTRNKDRLSVLKVFQNTTELEFILSELTYELLDTFHLPTKWINQLKLLPQQTAFTETEFNTLIDEYLSKLGSQYRTRIYESAAIAFYHQQSTIPVIKTLLCDDAPQFKLLTDDLALCWVHEGRHYKKLSPFVACHQKVLDDFLERFWKYYRKLLAYRDSPSRDKARELESEFWRLFTEKTGYEQLDERKRLTAAKAFELLLVLEHPELPLHNNPAELAARTMVQRRNISYATQTEQGTKAWDIFMSLVATTRKLGISFFEYMRDRISQIGHIPSLGSILRDRSSSNPFGWSWIPE
ncbi:Regulator of replication initiation timing [Nostoc flagelliforme CCNUN1]|uniref:Regulator of replication initiation timing n=1 Tax=Nostoc flagelliforme CCNUN1 TaxID=2038116 RepID=A0A2K8ST91_9NOSO|nr:transposase [Nostoc flagelliforme]AUB38647.1 Regulator of replication initiation timing [Nostoc flagelliforme CCNUN1]